MKNKHVKNYHTDKQHEAVRKAAKDRGLSMPHLYREGVIKEAPELKKVFREDHE